MSPNNTTHTEHTALISRANTRRTHPTKQEPTWAASTSRYAHVFLPSIIPSRVRGPQICNLQCRCFRLLQNVEFPSDHHNHTCFCMTGWPAALDIRVCPLPANHHRAIHCAVNPPLPTASFQYHLHALLTPCSRTLELGERPWARAKPVCAPSPPISNLSSLALDARARVDYVSDPRQFPSCTLGIGIALRLYIYAAYSTHSTPSPALHVLAIFRAIPSPTPGSQDFGKVR